MPKTKVDYEILRMALAGYELEKQKIDERIREVRALLNGPVKPSSVVEKAAPVRKRRKMSAAARKRIGDATRKRWALGRMNKKKRKSRR